MSTIRWLLVLISLACGVAAAPAATPVEGDRIVAVVNDEVITMLELRTRLAQIERQLAQQNTPLPARNLLERQVLERMIMEKAQL